MVLKFTEIEVAGGPTSTPLDLKRVEDGEMQELVSRAHEWGDTG